MVKLEINTIFEIGDKVYFKYGINNIKCGIIKNYFIKNNGKDIWVEYHIEDKFFEHESVLFKTKEECINNMIKNFTENIKFID
ncbi:MAG: hypothetical protein EOL97_10045 [Spirochaetia bacterium]|nr:hypothetical protein [Spirochaetia bacterium]